MNISIKTTKCDNCGSTLPYEVGRDKFFCSYCGKEIIIENGNELEDIQSEILSISNKASAEKKYQIEQIKQEIDRRRSAIYAKIKHLVVLAFIGVLISLIGIAVKAGTIAAIGILIMLGSIIVSVLLSKSSKNMNTSAIVASFGGKIHVPEIARNGVGFRSDYISSVLKKAGFTNVKCIPSENRRLLTGPFQIETIKVGNYDIKTLPEIRFDPNVCIEIYYYETRSSFL